MQPPRRSVEPQINTDEHRDTNANALEPPMNADERREDEREVERVSPLNPPLPPIPHSLCSSVFIGG
jgi:hypothetical protein